MQDIFTPAQALAIDLKIDDGKNDMNGLVYASDGAGPRASCGAGIAADPIGDTNDCWAGATSTYPTSISGVDCHLMVKFLPYDRGY